MRLSWMCLYGCRGSPYVDRLLPLGRLGMWDVPGRTFVLLGLLWSTFEVPALRRGRGGLDRALRVSAVL